MDMAIGFHTSSFSLLTPRKPSSSSSSSLYPSLSKHRFGLLLSSSPIITTSLKFRPKRNATRCRKLVKCSVSQAAQTTTEKKSQLMRRRDIRNIAIIAHVNHGKTTLVDSMLKQAKVFCDNQFIQERIMDSNDLECERGITMLNKNTSITFKDTKINIIDTPGHSDFGGEVEHILNMVEGVLLVVDSVEGPIPQTRFVLKKALEFGLAFVVVANKIDRLSARPAYVINSTLELFIELNATDEQCDFQAIYASGIQGKAGLSPDNLGEDLGPLFEAVIRCIPGPLIDKDVPQEPQACSISSVSSLKQTLLSNDWPQFLKVSIESGDFMLGQAVHAYLLKSHSEYDTFQANNLVNLYAKFRRPDDAQRVFNDMLVRNTITWTSLMKGYLEDGNAESVFQIACEMHRMEEKFNEHTCSVILQACNSPEDGILGGQIHGFIIKSGFEDNVFVGTSLISMYSRTGYFSDAEKVFNSLGCKDVRCMNFMILEYSKAGYGEKAFKVFVYLISSGFELNDYTFPNIISVCNDNVGVEGGKQLQGLAVKYGFVRQISVGNAIVSMYGKHGMVEEAKRMFSAMSERNLISWTALISSYARSGQGRKAISCFVELLGLGIFCDSICLATVIDGCSECTSFEFGLQLHGFAIKLGHVSDVSVGTALTDLYAKCGNLKHARMVFDGLPHKNIASLNAILVGYMETNADDEEDAMILCSQQRLAGMKPDVVTFSRLLSLSANHACLVRGSSLHAYTIKTGFEADPIVGNALITMYAKCGSIEGAYRMFKGMSGCNLVSWNAMLSAYALHGQGKTALLLFEEMKREGLAPDDITILAVLQACSYSGLWEDGIRLFNEIEPKYGGKPILEHFACMVDLLGRACHLSEAMNLIKNSPFPDSPLLWRSLVSVSKLIGDLNFSMLASKHLLNLEPEEAGSYILVSNIYAGEGMLDEAAKVRTTMNDLKLSKEAGCSWIEIDNKVHRFVASDKEHRQIREIYVKLDLLTDEMKLKYDDDDDDDDRTTHHHLVLDPV
ncbi:hypothetical protein LWI28_023512 [Acer negundo]|uniref:Tr-type G domain-containing protein n=1 Tax=Acer negundo TaxID=4023 RepID=A0AAD5NKH6_ACENE|nr:hypothetical protein LWI28_023512 [Acer negundo]